jgi:hypothetical protein
MNFKVFKRRILSLATALVFMATAPAPPVFASVDPADEIRLQANAEFCLALERCAKLSGADAEREVESAVQARSRALAALHASIEPPVESDAAVREPVFRYSDAERESLVRFLKTNRSPGGLPLSYRPPKGYWKSIGSRPDQLEHVMERLLTGEEGFADAGAVNLYDAATWQIAMALAGHYQDADAHTARLVEGRCGELFDIRAWDEPFRYGESSAKLPRENAFFFRMVSDSYRMRDPLDSKEELDGFPTSRLLHHEDWKPIAGENSWAAVIGPVQTAWIKNGGVVPWDAPELKLALSILPAVEAMQSSIGAIYHVPSGTHGKHPRDISNENNVSMYAALRMLRAALRPHAALPQARREIERIDALMRRMEEYFRTYLFDRETGTFHQGGFWLGGKFIASGDFAVDVQTWGLAILGAEWVNREIGGGDDAAAYRIWKNTKRLGGYYEDGVLRGVGFTRGHDVLSSEWTFGAILMARETAAYYRALYRRTRETRYLAWANEFARDARTMRDGVEALKVRFPDGSAAYKYSNKRYYIVFGWWANPVPTLTTSWAVMLDRPDPWDYFNPFVLGGAPVRFPPLDFAREKA